MCAFSARGFRPFGKRSECGCQKSGSVFQKSFPYAPVLLGLGGIDRHPPLPTVIDLDHVGAQACGGFNFTLDKSLVDAAVLGSIAPGIGQEAGSAVEGGLRSQAALPILQHARPFQAVPIVFQHRPGLAGIIFWRKQLEFKPAAAQRHDVQVGRSRFRAGVRQGSLFDQHPSGRAEHILDQEKVAGQGQVAFGRVQQPGSFGNQLIVPIGLVLQ